MYLILSTLYYALVVLNPTASYILLSANIEDVRSIAEQFVPREVAVVADAILERARDAVVHNNERQQYVVFYNKTGYKDATASNVIERANKPKNNKEYKKYKITKHTSETPLHFVIDLNELIETVKNKLHIDEEQTQVEKTTKNSNLEPVTSEYHKVKNRINRPLRDKKHQSRHIKQSRDEITTTTTGQPNKHKLDATETQHKKKQRPIDKKYLAKVFVAKPPKYILEYGKTKTKEPTTHNTTDKKIKSHRQNDKFIDLVTENSVTTTENSGYYVGVDLNNLKDSYEDYVFPKKDADYKETVVEKSPKYDIENETSTLKKVNIDDEIEIKRPKIPNKQIFLDVFSDDDKLQYKDGVHYDEETINYNKKKRTEKKTIRDIKNTPKILPLVELKKTTLQPYIDQLDLTKTVTESEKPVTEDTVSEIIYLGDEQPSPKPVKENVKANKKPKKATLIPKRDFYTISTPNYLLQIPIIGESYRFDEPIPEEDRVPEILKDIGNPPASINAKVELESFMK